MVIKRILARKSILGFGKFDVRDLSVQMILDLGKKNILINAYYNLDKIGFADDILDELGITPEYRIEKPGKNYEIRRLFYINRKNSMTDFEKMIDKKVKNKELKIKYMQKKQSDITIRKEFMRAKNHNKR